MTEENDIAALALHGKALRTRDRRDVVIIAVDPESGRISGTVPMFGPCQWLRNGRYEAAPGGGAGPLDLMPPENAALPEQAHASIRDALDDPAARNACCD